MTCRILSSVTRSICKALIIVPSPEELRGHDPDYASESLAAPYHSSPPSGHALLLGNGGAAVTCFEEVREHQALRHTAVIPGHPPSPRPPAPPCPPGAESARRRLRTGGEQGPGPAGGSRQPEGLGHCRLPLARPPARSGADSGHRGKARTPPALPFPFLLTYLTRQSRLKRRALPASLNPKNRVPTPPPRPVRVCMCTAPSPPPGPQGASPAGQPAAAPERLSGGGSLSLPPRSTGAGGSWVPAAPQAPSFPRSPRPESKEQRQKPPQGERSARRAGTVQGPRQGGCSSLRPLTAPGPLRGAAGTGAFGKDEPHRSRPPFSPPAPRSCLLPFNAGRLRPHRELVEERAADFKPPAGSYGRRKRPALRGGYPAAAAGPARDRARYCRPPLPLTAAGEGTAQAPAAAQGEGARGRRMRGAGGRGGGALLSAPRRWRGVRPVGPGARVLRRLLSPAQGRGGPRPVALALSVLSAGGEAASSPRVPLAGNGGRRVAPRGEEGCGSQLRRGPLALPPGRPADCCSGESFGFGD
ncbi:collagen alpha-1(III) chain-like [Falco naumanni]|uniref:collagen alpha-1(III) chain-like n=1 Tax=Falco naumanni TaxID=148594 RepID=UPI001ADE5BE5|nr:collagen alpha-1(III) chain-like [Falco naumanni]